jgi:cyclopropane-fatty-acyl-phospholipid synthase
MSPVAVQWMEQGILPDALIRAGIRRLVRKRLASLELGDTEARAEYVETFVRSMDFAPIAPTPHLANEQHYEVPSEFFEQVLGPHRKYSACYWPAGVTTLAQAEGAALEVTCSRAGIGPGMHILELGCGWGSLTLWMAEHYPSCQIVGVSNSASQREYILGQASRRGLRNVQVLTCDMNEFQPSDRFDRVISVEMFEHMRNYRRLLRRVHDWLVPGGHFFMHIFCHGGLPYEFLDEGPDDWMGRHFFSGGIMPSDDLPLHFQQDLHLLQRWRWNGQHYEKTANAWLANLDRRRDDVLPVLERTYGPAEAMRWHERWRAFFMACAELFGHERGERWWVSHYLFERPVGEFDL